jgi:Tfp pilus assembly protein PilZ
MVDGRLHQRFAADVLDMHGMAAHIKVVRILDMSLNGISLKIDSRLDVGRTCILKINREGRVLNIKSIVVWSLLDNHIKVLNNFIPIYRVGLKFIDIPKKQMIEVIRFIVKLKQKIDKQMDILAASGLRQRVRFQIEAPEKALLVCRKDYKIKNLSLGGMLIESQDQLDIGETLYMKIIPQKGKSIKVSGKVVSHFLIEKSNHANCDVGIEFCDMLEKDREMLKEVIHLLENAGFAADVSNYCDAIPISGKLFLESPPQNSKTYNARIYEKKYRWFKNTKWLKWLSSFEYQILIDLSSIRSSWYRHNIKSLVEDLNK